MSNLRKCVIAAGAALMLAATQAAAAGGANGADGSSTSGILGAIPPAQVIMAAVALGALGWGISQADSSTSP